MKLQQERQILLQFLYQLFHTEALRGQIALQFFNKKHIFVNRLPVNELMPINMKRVVSLALCAILFAQGAFSQNIPDGFDEYCSKTFEEWQVPGLSVVVVKDGAVVYLKGFGTTETQGGVPVDPVETRFALASTTKAFTGALLATVVDEYDVKWDDPVQKHLPDFKLYDDWVTKNIMVKEVNTHHSGVRAYSLDELPALGYDRDDIYHILSLVQPAYSFRSRYAYCNSMYSITAKLIERYTGMSWNDALEERLFGPLGMTHSTTGDKDSAFFYSPNIARGYNVRYKPDGTSEATRRNVEETYVWMRAVAPAAFVLTTAADMGNWLKMHLAGGELDGKTVITRKNHKMLFDPQTIVPSDSTSIITYGQGWNIEQKRNYRIIRHAGTAGGYTSFVAMVPEMNLGIALLCNNGTSTDIHKGIVNKLIDMYRGCADGPDWAHNYYQAAIDRLKPVKKTVSVTTPPQEPLPALKNSAYIGRYDGGPLGKSEIYEKDGGLWIRLKAVDLPLKHRSGNKFSFYAEGMEAGNYYLTFNVDRKKAKSFTLELSGSGCVFVKK